MSLPITHFLYLAFALLAIGLCGVLLRRSLLAVLAGVQLIMMGAVLLAAAYARHHGDPNGQVLALMFALVALLELALAAAVVLRAQTGSAHDWLADWTREPGAHAPRTNDTPGEPR